MGGVVNGLLAVAICRQDCPFYPAFLLKFGSGRSDKGRGTTY